MPEWPANQIEMRAIESLHPYALNPRTHTDAQVEQIAKAIVEWGWTNPILIDEQGKIIAGHGRLRAAQSLNISQVPCMIASGWSHDQIRAYVIADNQLALNAGWNDELLAAELSALEDAAFDVSLVGMSDEQFDALMRRGSDDGHASESETVGDDRLLVIVEFQREQEREHGALFDELKQRGLAVKVVS